MISVSDKRGLAEFARGLRELGVEIISTGGTAAALRAAGVEVRSVSEVTGFPEILDGRVKTLHPRIHGGLLAVGDDPEHLRQMHEHGIDPIDMVVVNLYPFEETVAKPSVTFDEAIENIDIGGPTMLRAASKNFQDVAVVVDPTVYPGIIGEMKSSGGALSRETKLNLAKKVFAHTARYDTLIADYLTAVIEKEPSFPEFHTTSMKRVAVLRYGENPHQKAAIYKERTTGLSLADAKVLQGKEMSFNNYLDTHSALLLALEFRKKACLIIKHNNPCGDLTPKVTAGGEITLEIAAEISSLAEDRNVGTGQNPINVPTFLTRT